MEFEDQEERGETEEEEEDEAEEHPMEFSVGYDSLGNSSRVQMGNSGGGQPAATTLVLAHQSTTTKPRYKECLKNHAVGLGGHAVDGCGEFIAAGAEGTLDALKCAACNCHRNFHRKVGLESPSHGGGREIFFHGHPLPHPQTHHLQLQQFAPYYRPPTGYLHVAPQQQRPLALPSSSGGGQSREDQEDVLNPSGGYGGGGGESSSRKRFRTKFTQEQKEKMVGLAERLGWKMQRQDEALVQQFCNETGVKRNVLKVWMHNNKHTLGKKP